ncbi:MAG: 4Fe-4S dicluster domain-containing protein, partial [Acidobacteria bacterium]
PPVAGAAAAAFAAAGTAPPDGLELTFQLSRSLHDGRFANLAWLQELPDAMTKIVWDNALLISRATAAAQGLESGDVVRLTAGGRSLEVPVWILPGQADDSVALELGYGRTAGGRVADAAAGANAYALRTSEAPYVTAASLEKTGRRYELTQTQEHGSLEGRDLVREGSLDHYRADPGFAKDKHGPVYEQPFDDWDYDRGHQWGMAIDLNACIGCNACIVACQSENNIPVVGREQVGRGREMHWLRVDRYFSSAAGDPEHAADDPEVAVQPVPCMHCENAPCEQVCPVAATVHDEEGLNAMVYNRCIGTRYCSNNCPYKVRRFNFFNYTKDTPELLKMAMNPDVTVRSRGVMEKCTYCLQRISEAKINAKLGDRPLRDGDARTACQTTCPTEAIVFGDLNDPSSAVRRRKASPRDYVMLGELNNRPRTSYQARVRNPNPAWEEA